MPNGSAPLYNYRPSPKKGEPFLRSRSARRGRLTAGGTYFRAREVGEAGNLISIQLIEYEAPTELTPGDAVCVITNFNINSREIITGPATGEIFDIHLSSLDEILIDQLDTTSPRARYYSISLKIAPPPPVYVELPLIRTGSLFSLPGNIAVKLTPVAPVFTPADVVSITPRRRVYRLVKAVGVDPVSGLSVAGWDIADLRDQINAGDPWVEMPTRGSDVNDQLEDDAVAVPFPEVRLTGGDGLPAQPDSQITGPMRSIIHINYGEKKNGSLGSLNAVFEWVGNSASDGSWKRY